MLVLASSGFAGNEIRLKKDRDRLEPLQKWNIKLSELAIDLEYRTRVTADNNTNNAAAVDKNFKQEGVAWENGFFGEFYWPITRLLELQGTFYLGYLDYPGGDGTEGLIADATTSNAIEFEMRISERSYLYFFNDVNINVDNFYDSAENDTEGLRMFENDAALQYEVDLSTLQKGAFKTGVRTERSITDDFDNRDRNTYYAALLWVWRVNKDTEFKPYAVYRQHRYVRGINNDAGEYEFGMGMAGKLTEFTNYSVGAGYQTIDFDTTHTPEAVENGRGASGHIAVFSELTQKTRHGLSVSVDRRLGYSRFINVVTDFLTLYSVQVEFAQDWTARLELAWLYADEESDEYGTRYDYLSSSLEFIWQFAENANASLGYRHSEKDSRTDPSDFKRDQVWLGMNWDF